MAGELITDLSTTGLSLYVLIRDSGSQVWNGGAFEAYLTANYANYDIPMVEQGTASKTYVGTFPAAIPKGIYTITTRVGASPAEGDPKGDGLYRIEWDGANVLPRSDVNDDAHLAAQALTGKREQMIGGPNKGRVQIFDADGTTVLATLTPSTDLPSATKRIITPS